MTEFFDHNATCWPSITRKNWENRFEQRTTIKLRINWKAILYSSKSSSRVIVFSLVLALSIRDLNNFNASWYFVSNEIVLLDLVRILANSLTVYSRIIYTREIFGESEGKESKKRTLKISFQVSECFVEFSSRIWSSSNWWMRLSFNNSTKVSTFL